MFASNAFEIRAATSSDAATLRRLSQLDSQQPIKAPALVGAIDGHRVAAISLADGRVVADPFVPTDALTAHLRMRARALQAAARTPSLVDRMRAGIRRPAYAASQAA